MLASKRWTQMDGQVPAALGSSQPIAAASAMHRSRDGGAALLVTPAWLLPQGAFAVHGGDPVDHPDVRTALRQHI